MKNPHCLLLTAPLLIISVTCALGGEAFCQQIGVGRSGTGGVYTTKTTVVTRTVEPVTTLTPLEFALALWSKGDKAAAIEKFLQIDWSKNQAPPFRQGSPLSTREQDLAKMSGANRDALMREANEQLMALKHLATATRDKVAAAPDKDLARRYLTRLDECGRALDQPDGMLILKLTAKSIRKLAAPDSKISRKQT